jgi:hypothetical protein
LAKPFKVAELKRRITETLHAPSSTVRVGGPTPQFLVVAS